MRLDTIDPRGATLTSAVVATTLDPVPLPVVASGPLQRAAAVVGELLALVGIVFCIPLVILGIGTPIALSVRLLLWIGGVL